MVGNLNAHLNVAVAQTLRSSSPFTVSGAAAVAGDLINSLDTATAPYADGDRIIIEGVSSDGGTQVFSDLVVSSTSTVQDLVDAISSAVPDATARLEQGAIVVEADDTGRSLLTLSLRNDSANAGVGLSVGSHQFSTDEKGEAAGTAVAIATVYDVQGGAHELSLKFTKKTDDSWTLDTVMDPSEGTIVDGVIDNIMFNDAGEILGSDSPTITLQFEGISVPQTVRFDFGNASSATALSHFSADSSLSATADGSAPGNLTGVQIDSDGEVKGVASNGKVFTLAKLAIVAFSNSKGLVGQGDNLYSASLNSGQPEVGEAGTGRRGTITGGQLEASNVDVSTEFTKLIVAQTGYNASARTITVASELLDTLTDIVR